MNQSGLYDQIIVIMEEYLGPAAERFMARQITFHLHKSPDDLTPEDLPKLTEWTKVTLGLLTEDRELIEEYADRMAKLVDYV